VLTRNGFRAVQPLLVRMRVLTRNGFRASASVLNPLLFGADDLIFAALSLDALSVGR
jgi:hypothetical protein